MFAEYPKSEGIKMETIMPYTPQSNGVVEQANCMIMEGVWYMLDNAGLWRMYCALPVSVVVYLKNCTPTWQCIANIPTKA